MKEQPVTVKTWKNRIVLHVGLWLVVWVAFYLMVQFDEGHAEAVQITMPIILAGPLPVYVHFVALARLFERRRYLAYVISLIAIVAVSSLWAEFVHSLVVNDPDSHTNGLGLAVMYLTFSTGFRYFSRGMSQQYRLQETEFKQLQTEMALLRSRVDPHFMMNTLNNLYALSLDRDPRLPDLILKLSELMRYLLDTSKQKSVPLVDEIRFVKNYVEFEKLRLNEGADVRLRVEGESGSRQVAPMLMIPLVENCFKHGLRGGGEGNSAHIHIDIDVSDERIRFAAENDKAMQAASTYGMGLEILERRLALLYPDRYQLSISDDGGTYKVEMILWV
ncbi:MAG: histidine kinase [Candidatus Latescibacterota bacterium]|nr:MAG: histidine kinase [Candidatus Latescibacterota bacterium]